MKQKHVLFWNSLAFSVIQQILAVWILVPLPFLNPACISGISQFMYSWNLAWRILNVILLAREMSTIVQWFEHSLAFPVFEIRVKTALFQSCGHCWLFQICWPIECSWRRQWHLTPVLLPGKSHGRRSLVGCHLWGCTELDTTEVT